MRWFETERNPLNTWNVPTWVQSGHSPGKANGRFDYAIASRGFHERVMVCALNQEDEWGPSDHCRLLIEVETE